MVTIILDALATQPAGLVQVTVDGQTTRWDRGDLRKELGFWQKRVAQEEGGAGGLRYLNLGGAF